MNKIISFAIIALFTFTAYAQNQSRKGRQMNNMTPDQVAELQTKKMTLDLDLSKDQQKKVYNLNKQIAFQRDARRKEMLAKREKGVKLTDDEKYQRKNQRLDAQIAHQNQLKKILNEKQFETWKKNNEKRRQHLNKKMSQCKSQKNSQGKKSGRNNN